MPSSATPTGRPSSGPRGRYGAALVGAILVVAALLGWWLRPKPSAPRVELAWALEAEATPAQLWVGSEVEVPVTIRNLGEDPWTPELGDRLAYHWRSEAGELEIRDGLRTPLPIAVGPGQAIELRARVRPPEQPGRYQLEWAIVREGVTWFPPPQGVPRTHAVEVTGGELGWALVAAPDLPESLAAGELVRVPVELENTGEIPWDPEYGDALAYHWWSGEGAMWAFEGRRTGFVDRVEPGERVAVALELVAPSHLGPGPRRMCVELEPVRERVRWFGPARREAGAERLVCTIVEPDPLGWALLVDATPTTLALDERAVRVPVTVQNTGTEAWAADDQLGYRWRSLTTGALIDGPRTPLPSHASGGVEPDRVVELEARVSPPPEPGRYELRWGLIRRVRDPEGGPDGAWTERWYAQPDPAAVTREVEVGGSRLAWALLRAERLDRVWVNRSTTVEVELRNLGTEAWAEETGDHLAYHWLDADGRVLEQDGLRTSFARPVAPGESITVRAHVRGPSEPGELRLQWELVREHQRWFGAPAPIGAGAGWADASDPSAETPTTRARWRAIFVILGFGLATSGGLLGLRLRPPVRGWAQALVEAAPLIWAWAAILILVGAFHEFSAIKAWSSAWWIEASGAWIVVVPLAGVRGRARAWLAVALVAFLAALALADLVYMHYFGSIVPIVALTASHHLGEVGDSAVAELEPVWAWLAVVPLAGLVAALLWPRIAESPPPTELELAQTRRERVWLRARPRVIAVGVCLVLAGPATIELGVALTGELGQRVFSEQAIVGRFGYVNAHLFDLARNLRERGRRGEASPEQRARVLAWFEARAAELAALDHAELDEPEAPSRAGFGAAAGDNLLLIQVEALQTWVIGLEVEGVEVTPLLNRLRTEADWYPYLIDQTNQGKTSDAEYSTLNSQHPLGEGAVCFLRADNRFFTLAHVLGERGYASLSAHPYKRGFWNRAVLHPRYGFERSLFRRELGPGQETGWGLADGLFFERMIPELRGLPEPWFGFLITLSLHHPYDEFPDNLDTLDVGALEGTRVGNYLEAMHYFDQSLAQLLVDLDEAGLLDHTVVALYGDHDARFELDEYPEVLRLAGLPDWDPGAFARLERVPLFVRVPAGARPPAGEVDEVGGHVDIGPTLLHALGVARPRGFVGRALVPSDDGGFAAYPDGSGYARERVYVATGKGIPPGGGCFEFPEGDSRPLAECDGLRERAAEELEVSRMVVDFDLQRVLSGGE